MHVIHEYDEDFYDEEIRVIATGYIRNEAAFSSLGGSYSTQHSSNTADELITAIQDDISFTKELLDTEPYQKYKTDKFLTEAVQ